MTAREQWSIKWIWWMSVQEWWTTVVSNADVLNFVWWWTVTDVWWVATINIPYWCTWYREDVPAWSATYTFINSPATATSFLIFTDSWTLLFEWIDYTYNSGTETVTFLSLWPTEAAYIWVAHASVYWGNIWDMVKAIYDPTNIQRDVYDYNNFYNTPTIPAPQIQSDWNQTNNTALDYIRNKPVIPAPQVQADWNENNSTQPSYILNKPTIPAAQVQSDWNEVDNTQPSYILNKPTIPAAQVNSDWNAISWPAQILNKPTIPAAQVNSDWNANSGVAEILNKPTIPQNVSDLADWANYVQSTDIKTINGNTLLGWWDMRINDAKVSATAPSPVYEWMLWYDTANDVLKTFDWTNWIAAWWWAWDMLYSDFWFNALSGTTITLTHLSNTLTTAADITVTPWTSLKPWLSYLLKVTNSDNSNHTMTFNGTQYLLPANSTVNHVFLALTTSTMEYLSWWYKQEVVAALPLNPDTASIYYITP